MSEELLHPYLTLSAQDIQRQLLALIARTAPEPGRRQVPFTPVETLLCCGLFYQLDPHKYGGSNMHTVPPIVTRLADLFRRTPASILYKMLNLDGSRTHSAGQEPRLFAILATDPLLYPTLYTEILATARQIQIDETVLPDFLGYLSPIGQRDGLLGQEELPNSIGALLADAEQEMQELDRTFSLGEQLTEKLAERKVRLAQHRFVQAVLDNCERRCVFCGFEPRSLSGHSGLLRASHIKPWAISTSSERVDVRNGLTACPLHDVAFDQGYLTVNGGYRIHKAHMLLESIAHDPGVNLYFGETLYSVLSFPEHARRPAPNYLRYHQEHIFKG